MSTNKDFDCVEMKREGSRHVYDAIKNLSPEEELAFWAAKTKALDRKIAAAKRRAGRGRAA